MLHTFLLFLCAFWLFSLMFLVWRGQTIEGLYTMLNDEVKGFRELDERKKPLVFTAIFFLVLTGIPFVTILRFLLHLKK